MALVPAQRTLTVLIRKTLDYIMSKNDSEIDVVATDAINDGIDEINTRNWRKLIKQDDTAFVADTRTYDLPTDFRAPRSMEKWDSSSKSDGRIYYKELKTLLNENQFSTNSGTPSTYSTDEQARKIILNVAPDSAFVSSYPKYNLWYHYRQVHLAGSSTAMTMPVEFDGFLVWRARATLASFRRPDAARYADNMATKIWRELVANDNDSMTDWE